VPRMSADARRAALLQAALRVMSRDGIAAGTTRAIVAEAGMPLATFHYCFRSRNELLRELITLVTSQEQEATAGAMAVGAATALQAAGAAGVEFRETLRQGLRGYIGLLTENPGHELFLFELNHYALRTPELHDLAQEQYRTYYETAGQLLVTAAELCEMTWTMELPVLARLVVTLIDGATTTWLADRDTEGTLAALDLAAGYVAGLAVPSDGLGTVPAQSPDRAGSDLA
jgi:TetR/AcrR family transcriptional regulator, regulator of biofilm formation and stress response